MRIKTIENILKKLNQYQFLSFFGIFVVFFIFFAILQFSFTGSLDPDGYYHIKHAYLIRTEGLSAIQSFPWTQYSILSKYPSDIWIGYHLLLIPFTFFNDLLFGAKLSSVVFSALFCLIFYYLLKKLKVRFPFFWTSFLLFVNYGFLFRLLLPRDFIFSIICIFLSIYFIFKRKYIALFFVSWFFALTYPAALILLGILAFVYLVLEIIYKKIFDFRILTSIIPGVIFGLVLRPDFPNNLKILFVTNILTVFYKLKGVGLNFGAEFMSNYNPFNRWDLFIFLIYLFVVFVLIHKFSHKTTGAVKKAILSYLFFFVVGLNFIIFYYSSLISSKLNIVYFAGLLIGWLVLPAIGFLLIFSKKKIIENQFSFLIFYLFCLSSLFLLFSFFAARFIEYFMPLTILFAGVSLTHFFPKVIRKKKLENRFLFKLKGPVLLVFPFLFLGFSYFNAIFWLTSNKSENYIYTMRETAGFLRENTKNKELILHLVWSDFPGLFYFNDKNYYISAMDPTFMYVYNKEIYWSWIHLRNGVICDVQNCPSYRKICSPRNAVNIYQTIKNYFPVKYIFLGNPKIHQEFIYLLTSRPDLFREVPRKDYFLRSRIFEIL
jgi:hypothetical protein